MTEGERLSQWLDKQDCIELVYRMARAIDRVDEALLRSLFWPDATDDHGLIKGIAEEFIAAVIPMLGTMISTQHNVANVLVEVHGSRARAESYFVAQHTLPGADGAPAQEMIAAGRYLDTFEKRDGVWKYSHRHAVYDWNASAPYTSGWDVSPMKELLARGARGPADPSYAHFAGR
jgi:hypothetical protein